jgi:hypothetical protein
VVDVIGMLWSAKTVDVTVADVGTVSGVLSDVAGVRRWLDGVEIGCAARLGVLAAGSPSMSPEHIHAAASRSSLRAAMRVADRAATVATVPELRAVLAAGATTAGHIDAVTAALRGLTVAQRTTLAAHGDAIAGWASVLLAEEFGKELRALVRRIEGDDGVARLARQKRAVRFRTWVDKVTGMIRLSGELDAETGAIFARRVDNQVDALFHDRTPPDCPADPVLRQDFLRAHALLDLTHPDTGATTEAGGVPDPTVDGGTIVADVDDVEVAPPARVPSRPARTGPGKVEMAIVIDLRTLTHGLHSGTRLDCGVDGVQLPLDTIRRLALYADIVPVIIDENGVVLKMGRTRRLATRDQRRAIRAMYRTCAIPGCATHVRRCEPHHIIDWEHDGVTDLDVLVPICKHHHDIIHSHHWVLALSADRRLTINKPDGTTMTTGPPSDQWR